MILLLQMIAELLDSKVATQTTAAKPSIFGRNGNGSGCPETIKTTAPLVVVDYAAAETFAESLTGLAYPEGWDADKIVVNLDPAAVALYKQSEETKKALRGL